jgi:sirohydrochlorin ferrochelatase
MDDSTALLVMVHGSPTKSANDDMFEVVNLIRARNLFRAVVVGFMECNEPTIPEAISECVSSGASRVVAVPYFLHVGTHVADDLPGLLEDARQTYPMVQFALGRHIGESASVTEILAKRIESKSLHQRLTHQSGGESWRS